MAESEVKSAALWLGKLLVDEINHLGGVRDEIEELHSELTTLAAFLIEAVKTRRRDQLVQTVLSDARSVAYDCQDVIETYILEVARHGYEEHEGCRLGSVGRWACLLVNAASVRQVHSNIAELNKRISSLKNRMISYGVSDRIINEDAINQCSPAEPLRRIYSHEREEHAIVGLENQLDELVDRLMNPNDQTMIAICGMGGIGKSTLAREVYHHPQLRDGGHFKAFGWCNVSRQFQPNSILQELMYSLVPENDHDRGRNIAEKIHGNRAHAVLYQLMKDEKCFVVIDDVWTSNDWAKLQAAFPRKSATGSRILLTTRNEETISRMDPAQVHLYSMKGLDERKSWELFEMISFSSAVCSHFEMEKLGRDMLEHCNGVPLAIVVLGEVLRRKEKVEDWKHMRDDVIAQINRGCVPNVPYKEVYDVLQVSYDELPFHLKRCFLYLANYPEDYEIPIGKLLQLWVAEGFILREGTNDELEEEVVAAAYFDELVGRNMVEVARRVVGGTGTITTSCRLHDLMRDICIELAKREGFLQIIDCQRATLTHHKNADHLLRTWLPKREKRFCRLAVFVTDQEPRSSAPPTSTSATMLGSSNVSRAPNPRSLLLFSVSKKRVEGNCKNFVKTISDNFPLLRVLSCEDFQVQGKLPNEVENLIHLRFLCLLNTLVNELPTSIHKLQWLQTLDLRVEINTVLSLPNVLWKMKQLRHLYLPYHGGLGLVEKQRLANARQRYVMKGGGMLRLDGLCSLQTLVFIDLDRVDLRGLSKLEKMDTISAICATKKEALYPFVKCSSIKSFMLRVHGRILNDDPLILSSCEAMHHLDIHAEPSDDFHLSQPLSLKTLPKSLVRVDVWYLQLEDDPLPVLEQLPNLAYLGLHMCYHNGKMVCSAGGFPKLTNLCFDQLEEFNDWEVEEGALQKLESLVMINCKVMKIPDALPSSVNTRMY